MAVGLNELLTHFQVIDIFQNLSKFTLFSKIVSVSYVKQNYKLSCSESFYFVGISNVKSREDLVMSGSDSSDPFSNAPFKKPGKIFLYIYIYLFRHVTLTFADVIYFSLYRFSDNN